MAKKKKIDKMKIITIIICAVLALMMILGVCYTFIYNITK